MAGPRMTLDDVLADMRNHGMSMGKKTLIEAIKQGVFPFVTIIGTDPNSRANYLIMRKDYNEWASEYLGGEQE